MRPAKLHWKNDEIIERMRIEKALRSSEEQYRLLAENVMDGIIIAQHGKLVFANKVFVTMSEYSLEHLHTLEPGLFFMSL